MVVRCFKRSGTMIQKGVFNVVYRTLDDVPLVVSVPELARILRVSRNTAYAMVRCGQIHAIRAGTQIRFPKKSIEMYLNVA